MVFAEHYRVSALGRIGNSVDSGERFSYGWSVQGGSVVTANWLVAEHAMWSDLADDVAAFHGRAASRISNQALLQEVKVAKIGPDGKYLSDPKILTRVTAGGVAHDSNVLPQNTLAISLNTDRRGPTGKGRFYIPMPVVDVDYNDAFRITPTVAASINASAEELIEAMNNLPGLDTGDFQVVVASSKGYNTPVSSVRTGRVVDSMRSRRRSIPELYSPNLDTD